MNTKFWQNKKSMTILGGILLLAAISIFAIYMLSNVNADQEEQNADAGNVTITLWDAGVQTVFKNGSTNYVVSQSIVENVMYQINFSIKLRNMTINISSLNVTAYDSAGLLVNFSTIGDNVAEGAAATINGTTANTTNFTRTNITNSRKVVLKWWNDTAIAAGKPSVLIKGGTTVFFWFNITADKPGRFNITIKWNATGIDGMSAAGPVDYGYNYTNITIVVTDTTAPTVAAFIDLGGVDTGAHVTIADALLNNVTPYINTTRSLNFSCAFSDNYNITNVTAYVIRASYGFGVAGAPIPINRTAAKFGFNASALNLNGTGIGGDILKILNTSANDTSVNILNYTNLTTTEIGDASFNYTNYSMVYSTLDGATNYLTTGKYLFYCSVTDNATNIANSTKVPFQITSWDVGGTVQDSTYTNKSGINVTLYQYVVRSSVQGQPVDKFIMDVNTTTNGYFNFTNIAGNGSIVSSAAAGQNENNYSGLYKIKINYITNISADGDGNSNQTVLEIGPNFPPMPKEMFISQINNSIFYTKPAVTFRLCAYNDSLLLYDPATEAGGNRTFNYEIVDDAIGYPIAFSMNITPCNTTVVVPQNRNYTISLFRMPQYYNGTSDADPTKTNESEAEPSPPISIQFTNLTSYSAGKIINVIKNLNSSKRYIKLNVTFSGNDTAINITNVSLYVVPHSGFVPLQSAVKMSKTLLVGADIWGRARIGSYNYTTAIAGAGVAVPANLSFPVLGSAEGIEYFVIVWAGNTTLGNDDVTQVSEFAWMGNFTVTTANISRNITLTKLLGGFDKTSLRYEYLVNITNSSGTPVTRIQGAEVQIKDPEFGTTRFVGFSVNASGLLTFPILRNSTWAKLKVYGGQYAPVEWIIDKSVNRSTVVMNEFNPQLMDPNGNRSNFSEAGQGLTVAFYKTSAACNIPYPSADCLFSSRTAKQDISAFNPIQAMLAGTANVRVNISTGVTMYFIGVDMLASGPPDMTMSQNVTNRTDETHTIKDTYKFGSMAPDVYDTVWVGVPYDTTKTPDSSTFTFMIPTLYNRTWGKIWDYQTNSSAQIPDEYVDYNFTMLRTGGIPCVKENWSSYCYVNTTDDMIWFNLPHFSNTNPTVIGEIASVPPTSSGGGGGSSITTPGKTNSWEKITPGAATIWKLEDADTGIKQIIVTVSNEAKQATITITKQAGQPATVEKSLTTTANVYKYMKIETANLSGSLDRLVIKVMVTKTWLTNHSLTSDRIAGYRYDETLKNWQELTTTKDSEDNTNVYYNIETTKTSVFAVGEKGGVPVTPTTPTPQCGNSIVESGENCETCPADVPCSSGQECVVGTCQTKEVTETKANLTWLWWTLGIVVVLVIVLIIALKRKK